MNDSSTQRRLIYAVKVLVAVALVAWLLLTGRLDVSVYLPLLAGQGWGWLLAGVLLQALSFLVFIGRWHGLASVLALPVSWQDTYRTGLQGLFTQLFVPGGLGTDGLRAWHVRRHSPERLPAAVASLFVDRAIGVIAATALGACASTWALFGQAQDQMAASALTAIFGAVFALGSLTALSGWWISRWKLRSLPRVRAALDGVGSALKHYRHSPRALGVAFAVSVIGHVLSAAASFACLRALGADNLHFVDVLAISCLLNLVRMLPITPMGLGVTDGAAEGLYRWIGVTLGAEQQMLQRLMSMCLFVAAGAAFLGGSTQPGRQTAPGSAPPPGSSVER